VITMTNRIKRPCLECRRTFTPINKYNYCADCYVKYRDRMNMQRKQKPRRKDTRIRGTRPYDSPQYRNYRRQLLSMATLCGLCLKGKKVDDPFQVDHIIPISVGGSNELENLQIAHRSCNARKKDKRDVIGFK